MAQDFANVRREAFLKSSLVSEGTCQLAVVTQDALSSASSIHALLKPRQSIIILLRRRRQKVFEQIYFSEII